MDADFREQLVREATANGFVVTVNDAPDLELGQDEAVELRLEGEKSPIVRFRGTKHWAGYIILLSAGLVYSADGILACLGSGLPEMRLAPWPVYNVISFGDPRRSSEFWKRLRAATQPEVTV